MSPAARAKHTHLPAAHPSAPCDRFILAPSTTHSAQHASTLRLIMLMHAKSCLVNAEEPLTKSTKAIAEEMQSLSGISPFLARFPLNPPVPDSCCATHRQARTSLSNRSNYSLPDTIASRHIKPPDETIADLLFEISCE